MSKLQTIQENGEVAARVENMPSAQTPMGLIQVAVEHGADPEKLEKLMDLQDRWEANNARKSFYQAMARFQSECPAIPKNGAVKSGAKTMYKFAKLEDIIKTIRKTEQDCGFRHRWDQEDMGDGGVRVLCHVSHIDGHEETTHVSIPPTQGMNTNKAQDRGLIITYGKRYSLLNAYGLEPDEDTDAVLPDPGKFINDNQANAIDELLSQLRPDDRTGFWSWLQIPPGEFEKIPASRYAEIVDKIRGKARGAK